MCPLSVYFGWHTGFVDFDADVNRKEYQPDRWVILKIGGDLFKVFGGWSGGYLSGDSWKLNSGIVRVQEDGAYWRFLGYSGSEYRCRKTAYGMTGYMAAVYESWRQAGNEFEILPEDYDFMWLNAT